MELIHWSGHRARLGRASRETILPSPAEAFGLRPLTSLPTGLGALTTTLQ